MVTLHLKNKQAAIYQAKVEIEMNESFMIMGDMRTNINIPPLTEEQINWVMLPLEVGNLKLPVFNVVLKYPGPTGQVEVNFVNQNYEEYIFVMPTIA